MAKRYVVVLERAESNWAAYSPQVPGCIATADTRDEVIEEFRAALEFHLEGLREDGLTEPDGIEPGAEVLALEVSPWREFVRASSVLRFGSARFGQPIDEANVAAVA